MGLEAARIFAVVGADTKPFARGMAGASAAVQGFAVKSKRKLQGVTSSVGRSMKFMGAGLLVAAALAVNAAGNFEQSLNIFRAVSGATAAQMDEVSKHAKALGADLTLPATSAKDAALAMTELVKGGLSVEDAMAAVKGVLQLSTAAQIENAAAATITARALNAFGLEGAQAGRVADVLANAANKSTGEITDFALGLQQSSAVAKQTGLSIEETVAALMGLANAGIVGSDAGTSLKTMLMRLNPQTKKARDLMKDLGIDVFDAKGRFIGIKGAIREYGGALRKMTPEQRQHALGVLFGSDAVRAANVLLMGGVKAYEKNRAAVAKNGTAAAVAKSKTEGFTGSVEAAKSATETLAISLGWILLPAATVAAKVVAKTANALDHLSPGAKHAGVAIIALGVGVWALSAAFSFLAANPIVLIIAALVMAGVALVELYNRSETFRGIVLGVFDAVKGAAKAVGDFFTGPFVGFFKSAFKTVKGALGSARDAFAAGWDAIKGAVLTAIDFVLRGFDLYMAGASKLLHVMGKMPGPMGAPFRAAAEKVDAMRGKVGDLRGEIARLKGKSVDVRVNVFGLRDVLTANGAISRLEGTRLNIPGRARGGTAQANRAYIVGERGPELFTPGRTGRVHTTRETGAALSSGGGTSYVFNVEHYHGNGEPDEGRFLILVRRAEMLAGA